jgi:hypothetical protein
MHPTKTTHARAHVNNSATHALTHERRKVVKVIETEIQANQIPVKPGSHTPQHTNSTQRTLRTRTQNTPTLYTHHTPNSATLRWAVWRDCTS